MHLSRLIPSHLSKALLSTILCVFAATRTVSGQIAINECSSWRDGRQMCVQASISQDGVITSEVTTQSKNLASGCTGGAVAVGSDEAGNALWTTELQGKASCSASDRFCPSFQKHSDMVQVNVKAAQHTTRIHLFYAFDEESLHERLREV